MANAMTCKSRLRSSSTAQDIWHGETKAASTAFQCCQARLAQFRRQKSPWLEHVFALPADAAVHAPVPELEIPLAGLTTAKWHSPQHQSPPAESNRFQRDVS